MPMVTSWSRGQLLGKRTHWIVTLTYAGREWRIAREDLDVYSSKDARWYHYDGVLDEVTYTEELSLFSEAITPGTVTIACVLSTNVLQLMARGHDIATMRGELAKVIEGDDYEERRVFLVGRALDPEVTPMGSNASALNISLEQSISADKGRIPEITAKVDDSTWDTEMLDTSDIGIEYPVIIGQPGIDTLNATFGFVTGSQAVWASKESADHYVILAGHRVAATEVVLRHADFTDGIRVDVDHVQDARGRTVAITARGLGAVGAVDDLGVNPLHRLYPGMDSSTIDADATLSAAFQPAVADTADVYVCWYDHVNPTYGGALGPDGKTVRAAGDVFEFVLGYSTLLVDYGRLAAAKASLASFKIDTVIEQGCKPWDWIAANLLPILPVSIVTGPSGVYPVVWRAGAREVDTVGHLDCDADPSLDIVGAIAVDTSKIANEFAMDFALALRTNEFGRTARLGAKRVESTAYALGQLRTDNDIDVTEIQLLARDPGPEGVCGWTLAVGALSVTDNLTTRICAITANGATTTVALENEINAVSALLRARQETSVFAWGSHCALSASGTLVMPDDGTMESYHCAASQARYTALTDDGSGVFREELPACSVVYDASTAHQILAWHAAAFAFAHKRLTLMVPENTWGWLRLGDVVLVSHADYVLSRQVAHVEAIEWGDDDMIGLRLLIIEEPGRDSRDLP